MATRLTVPLSRPQTDFRRSPATYRGFVGGRGAGKSFIGGYDLLRRAQRGRYYIVTAPTYKTLEEATWRTLVERGRALNVVARENKSDPSLTLGNGARIVGYSTEAPDRLRGPNASGLWMDEASQSPEEAFMLGIATLREAGEQGWCSATFTPRGKAHWTYKTFATGRPDTSLHHCATRDSPFLPAGFAGSIGQFYSAGLAQQELGGLFCDVEGAVFKSLWFTKVWQDTGGAFRLDPGPRAKQVYRRDCEIVVICDPNCRDEDKEHYRKQAARGGKEDGDYCAIGAFALTRDNDLLILDVLRERLDVGQIVPACAAMAQKWGAASVCIEDVSFTVLLIREARRYAGMPPVRALPTMGKNKLTRATQAVYRAQGLQVYLPAGAPWVVPFLDEILAFTGTAEDEHDDQVDVFAYAAALQSGKLVPGGGSTLPVGVRR